MRAAYTATRDRATATCDRLGLTYLRPGGAFYLWVTLPESIDDAERFAFDLVANRGVAVAPGTAFGPAGQGHVRVSLAADGDDVVAGLAAIADEVRN